MLFLIQVLRLKGKSMLRLKLIITFLLLLSSTVMADCNKDVVGAKYKIISNTHSNSDKISYMTLWRNGNQVAHEYENTHITEIWERTKNDKLRMVRHFDQHKRGIEYEPNEIKIQHSDDDWQLKKHLVTQSLINSMSLTSTHNEGCEILQQHVKENSNNEHMSLEWLPQQKLVKKLSTHSKKEHVIWELVSVIKDQGKVKQLFRSRSAYMMTDYADIGDNESDPFLMKMINLGFVAHGSSGMYDQHGNALEGGHRH